MRKNAIRRTRADRIFDTANCAFFAVIMLIIMYPLYFVLIASFSAPSAVLSGRVFLAPVNIDWSGYEHILKTNTIWRGYGNSIFYTALGTTLNVLVTMMAAFPLSRPDFKLRRPIMLLFIFTMYFSGGLIPTYLLMRTFNLAGSWPSVIILGMVSVWNVIVARTFLAGSLPGDIQEAARIDGCSDFRYFFQMVLPLSKALIAVLCLYYGMNHWNGYFTPMIYISKSEEYPLQLILRRILLSASVDPEMMIDRPGVEEQLLLAESVKYGLIIVSSIPLLVAYPFLQKYFVKGVMLGSVKG